MMVDKNKTEVIALIDETGSMFDKTKDIVGSVNSFIEEQQGVGIDDECLFTLKFFNSNIEGMIEDIEYRNDINDVEKITEEQYQPRGNTPLLDAIGKTITEFGSLFDEMEEHEKPVNVIMYIYTDGKENDSSEYDKQQIKSMVEEHENVWNWDFIFVEADPSAFGQGKSFGFSNESIIQYYCASEGIKIVFQKNVRANYSIKNGRK